MTQECDYIVVHCSASPNAKNDGRFDTAVEINNWHVERGFSMIGYHYVIDEGGNRQSGRPCWPELGAYVQGAGVYGHNKKSIHICLIGNKYFHEEQLIDLVQLLSYLKFYFKSAKIVGHTDLDSRKTCPNFNVIQFCKKWEIPHV